MIEAPNLGQYWLRLLMLYLKTYSMKIVHQVTNRFGNDSLRQNFPALCTKKHVHPFSLLSKTIQYKQHWVVDVLNTKWKLNTLIIYDMYVYIYNVADYIWYVYIYIMLPLKEYIDRNGECLKSYVVNDKKQKSRISRLSTRWSSPESLILIKRQIYHTHCE